MNKIVFLMVFCLLTDLVLLNAQERSAELNNGKVGFSFSSFGNNDVFRFNPLVGAASYEGENFFTFGISYTYVLNKWLKAESGIEYSKHDILISPNLPPGMDSSPREADFTLINVPLTLKANLVKFFFINGGFILDLDASTDSPIDNQTGLGAILGLAIKYDFDCGVSAFINPYTKVHSLIPFAGGDYHQRVWEDGFKIGVTYNFRRIK